MHTKNENYTSQQHLMIEDKFVIAFQVLRKYNLILEINIHKSHIYTVLLFYYLLLFSQNYFKRN